jgi:anti-sigma factor RsiW
MQAVVMDISDRKVTDYDIQALIDGELDEEQKKQVLEALTSDQALFSRYLVYKRQKGLLKSWWKDN